MSDLRSIAPRAPTLLRSIAVLGVVVAIVGTIVIWVFLSDLEETTDRSLLIGEQATQTLTSTIDVADQVLTAVDEGMVTVQSTLGTLDEILQSTAALASALSTLSATLPAGMENIDVALATLQRLGATIDSTLTTLGNLPIGPDYDPDVPLADAVGNIREALDPITQALTTVSDELQGFADGSGQLTSDIDTLVSDLERTREALSGADELLDEYRDAADDAGQLAAEARDNLSSSVNRMRFVLIALALLLVISQFVPWTLASVIEGSRASTGRDSERSLSDTAASSDTEASSDKEASSDTAASSDAAALSDTEASSVTEPSVPGTGPPDSQSST